MLALSNKGFSLEISYTVSDTMIRSLYNDQFIAIE